MKHFEIGDTVKCIKEYDRNYEIVGEEGIVKSSITGCVGIEFFNDVHGHGDCGKGKHCWYFCEFDGGLDCLELVTSKKALEGLK